jgi:hypothetical protein
MDHGDLAVKTAVCDLVLPPHLFDCTGWGSFSVPSAGARIEFAAERRLPQHDPGERDP